MVGDGEQATDMLGILRAARMPHDEAKEREEAKRREEEAERERLRSDPDALAERLRQELRYAWGAEAASGSRDSAAAGRTRPQRRSSPPEWHPRQEQSASNPVRMVAYRKPSLRPAGSMN
jgi:hypothetical protein